MLITSSAVEGAAEGASSCSATSSCLSRQAGARMQQVERCWQPPYHTCNPSGLVLLRHRRTLMLVGLLVKWLFVPRPPPPPPPPSGSCSAWAS